MDGQLIFANQALARMFDFDSREQFLAAGALSRWADPNQSDLFLTTLQEQGSVTNFETETITHTGRNIHVIFSATLKGDSISGMLMDITARRQAEQKLQDYQQRLKALAFQLTVAEENERRNIAADLHDNVGQSLVFARMALSNLVETTLEPEETAAVKEISDALLAALQETRSLVFELSSPAINELGLSAALSEWLDEQTGKRYGLQTEFIDNMDDRHRNILNDDVRTLLFRNVRELLTNVVKHARANTVRVQLKSDINKLKIMVEDDGVGFAPEEINNDSGRAEHYGLFSIQERMADLGGSFEIETSPGKGCKVFLNVPVEKDKH
jgi:signal transduction histidine kinase